MTKADIVSQISQKTGIDKATVLATVEAFMDSVKDSLEKEEAVYLRGFGSFILKKRAEKTCPLQTDEWLSASDLKNDETFPTASVTNISKKLQKLQDEMPEYIQRRKSSKGQSALCLHRDGLRLFLEESGIEFCPQKTDEWQSALDLQGDKSFPIRDTTNINKKLAKFQNEMPEFIQKRKPAKGPSALCLHRDGRQEFIKRIQKDKTESFVQAKDVIEAANKKRSIKIIPNKQNKR